MTTTQHRPADTAANMSGIFSMLAAMAAFTVVDTLVKLTSTGLPLGEMIVIRNSIAAVGIILFTLATTGLRLSRDAPWGLIAARVVGEVGSTLTFLGALVHMPIADAIAIVQFTPLAITAAAAIFFGEPVGWRRWVAAGVGFVGVLLIVRPGTGAFKPAALLALASLVFIVVRDVATRRITVAVPTMSLTVISAVSVGLSGFLLAPFETWVAPSPMDVVRLAVAGLFLLIGYMFVIKGMRTGDIAAVSPFRYSVILFAILSGWLVWGQLPDRLALIGIAVVVGAGLYTFWREEVRRRAGQGRR